MATTESDFALGDKATSYWSVEYDKLVAALEGLVVLFNAKTSTGTEPADTLQGIKLGDGASHNKMRLFFDGASLIAQRNTGTEGTPAWSDEVSVELSTGIVTLFNGSLDTNGNDVELGGGNITNAGTINGLSLSAHATRHQPGGADAFTFATPSDVASANAAGAATSFVRGDHAHRGVRSFNTAFGNVTVSGSTGITVSGTSATTVSSDLRVYAYADNTSPSDITLSATTPTILGGFSDLAFPGADGAFDYLVRFTAPIMTTGGAEQTLFEIRVGTNGDATDTAVGHASVETASSADPAILVVEALVLNPSSSSRVTITYDSTTGSRHIAQGGTDGRPILTITRLTGITTH